MPPAMIVHLQYHPDKEEQKGHDAKDRIVYRVPDGDNGGYKH